MRCTIVQLDCFLGSNSSNLSLSSPSGISILKSVSIIVAIIAKIDIPTTQGIIPLSISNLPRALDLLTRKIITARPITLKAANIPIII